MKKLKRTAHTYDENKAQNHGNPETKGDQFTY